MSNETNYWKHKNADLFNLRPYCEVPENATEDCSGIENESSYLWARENDIWYPMKQIAKDVKEVDKADQYFKEMPTFILDTKGRKWECLRDTHAGSFDWTCEEFKGVSVYATPYFDGAEDVPVTIVNEDGEEVKSWSEEIVIDATISISKALGKVTKPVVDIKENVRTMFEAMDKIISVWDEAGLNDDIMENASYLPSLPSYLPSFDEFRHDLSNFFDDRGQL